MILYPFRRLLKRIYQTPAFSILAYQLADSMDRFGRGKSLLMILVAFFVLVVMTLFMLSGDDTFHAALHGRHGLDEAGS